MLSNVATLLVTSTYLSYETMVDISSGFVTVSGLPEAEVL